MEQRGNWNFIQNCTLITDSYLPPLFFGYKIGKPNIFGKTIEHLQRHHAGQWSTVTAKYRAVRAGGEGLKRLRKAVGSLRNDFTLSDFDLLHHEAEAWNGASEIDLLQTTLDNNLVPRVASHRTEESLFGCFFMHALTTYNATSFMFPVTHVSCRQTNTTYTTQKRALSGYWRQRCSSFKRSPSTTRLLQFHVRTVARMQGRNAQKHVSCI